MKLQESCPKCHYMRSESVCCKCGLYAQTSDTTNELKMPEVIYATAKFNYHGEWQREYYKTLTSYTRTYKVQELKDKYEGGVWDLKNALEYARAITHPVVAYKDCQCRICEALTKASNLLK